MGNRVFLGVLVSAFVLVLQAPAQRQFITEKEYFDTVAKADLRDVDSYSSLTKEETIDHGSIRTSVVSVYDLAGNRWHGYTKATAGSVVTEVEQILINSIRYERKDGGDWTKTDIRTAPPTVEVAPEVIRIGYGTPCNQFTSQPSGFGGESMSLYEQYSVQNWSGELMFRISRVWIRQDGKPYREERISGKLAPYEETKRTTKTYAYDHLIKIEAPIP